MAANTSRATANYNKTKGYVNKGAAYLKGTNKIVLLLVGLFVLFVVGMIVYWIYKAIQKARKGDTLNPILVSGSIDASDSKNMKSWVLPTSSGSSSPSMAFTLSFWIYIADWDYRTDERKAIIVKDKIIGKVSTGDNAAPGIWLDASVNNLIVQTSIMGGANPQYCNVANIPIQKWTHVAYVLDNRTVDVYVDCKLERSCILSGVPRLNNNKLHLLPKNKSSEVRTGFLGQLSSLRYFSSALKPVDIVRLCNEGPFATKGDTTYDPDKNDEDSCPESTSADLSDILSESQDLTDKLARLQEEQGEDRRYPGIPYEVNFNAVGVPSMEQV